MSSTSTWLSNNASNRYIQTYMKGFLDMSGGHLILRNHNIYVKSGDVSINGLLMVADDVSLNSKLFVHDDVSMDSTLWSPTMFLLIPNCLFTVTSRWTASLWLPTMFL